MRVNIYDKIERSGMTSFWSPMFGYVDITLKDKGNTFPIVVQSPEFTKFISLTKYGYYFNVTNDEKKLLDDIEPMLYPSKKMRDWDKFYAPGDIILVWHDKTQTFGIFSNWCSNDYTQLEINVFNFKTKEWHTEDYNTEDSVLATPKEAKHIKRIITENRKRFKPKDWVLVDIDGVWTLDIFSHICNGDKYSCIGHGIVSEDNIIPYDEKLVGTKRD